MDATTSVKVCKLCGKDVSQHKRVKDPKGNYYCAECYATATAHKPAAAATPSPKITIPQASPPKVMPPVVPQVMTVNELTAKKTASPPAAAKPPAPPAVPSVHMESGGHDVEITADLASALAEGEELSPELLPIEPLDIDPAESEPAPAPAARKIKPASAADGGSSKLPSHCPACGTPVISGRRLCIKCNRDVTIPLAAAMLKSEPADVSDKVANVVGKTLKYAGILTIVALVVLGAFAIHMMFFADSEAYQPYPKTRTAAIQKYLESIATGTDKSFDKAFETVSYRFRTTNNEKERELYKGLFKRMNDDLVKKYGKDWVKTVVIDPTSHQDMFVTDDCEVHSLKIGKDDYTITTQVQISMEEVIGNIPGRQKAEYPENGKNRYGVLQMAEYPVDWR